MATNTQTSSNGPKGTPAPAPKVADKDAKAPATPQAPVQAKLPEVTKMETATHTAPAAETAPAAAAKKPAPLSKAETVATLRKALECDKRIADIQNEQGEHIRRLMESQGDNQLLIGDKSYTFRKRNRTQDDGSTKTTYHMEITTPMQIDPGELNLNLS